MGGYIQRTDTKLEPDGVVRPSRPISRGTLVSFKFLICEVSPYDLRTQDTACNPVVLLWNELMNPNSNEAFRPFLGGPRGGHEDSSSDSIITDTQMAIMIPPSCGCSILFRASYLNSCRRDRCSTCLSYPTMKVGLFVFEGTMCNFFFTLLLSSLSICCIYLWTSSTFSLTKQTQRGYLGKLSSESRHFHNDYHISKLSPTD
jgi:hypothetical protein